MLLEKLDLLGEFLHIIHLLFDVAFQQLDFVVDVILLSEVPFRGFLLSENLSELLVNALQLVLLLLVAQKPFLFELPLRQDFLLVCIEVLFALQHRLVFLLRTSGSLLGVEVKVPLLLVSSLRYLVEDLGFGLQFPSRLAPLVQLLEVLGSLDVILVDCREVFQPLVSLLHAEAALGLVGYGIEADHRVFLVSAGHCEV